MARSVEITVPSHKTDDLAAQLADLPQVASVQVQRGKSVQPPGDVLVVAVPNRTLHLVLQILDERDIGKEPGTSFSVSEPVALVESSTIGTILSESTDSSWEEMHQVLARSSNMTINAMFLMFTAGALAAVGISTGAIHIVIGAMVIAPGFEPLTRVALGAVAGGSALRRGLMDASKGYLALLLGAVLASVLLPAFGKVILQGPDSYLESSSLVRYWSSTDPTSLFITVLAGAAGAILVATNRTVLTAGVMIALALIPSAALIGSGLVAGDGEVAVGALVRWVLDVLLVTGMSVLVLWWKRVTVQRRDAKT